MHLNIPFKLIAFFTCWATVLVAQVNLTTSNLPIVLIDTENGAAILDEYKITAALRIVDNGPGQSNSIHGPFNDYDGLMGIETRGQTSQFFSEKKPYGIELRNAAGDEVNASLLGMPKESDWVLLSPFSDKSLIRDVLAFDISGRLSHLSYTPRTRMVEVVVNNEYRGVYVLTEKIKRDNDRVDIAKVDSADITGGYIVKLDKGSWGEFWESTFLPLGSDAGKKVRFFYHYPKPDDITEPQKEYIEDFMYEMEASLKSANFQNPTNGYQKYLDRASFIDFMLMNEVSRNVDGYRISSYFYKDRDTVGTSKLHAGPAWDFNIAFGNANYCQGESTAGWAWNFNSTCPTDDFVIPFWWTRLREDSNFLIETQQRWVELRSTTLSNNEINNAIDSLAALVSSGPANRNFQKWPILGTWQWPNHFVGTTHQQEINYLKTWTIDRLNWMDGAINGIYVGTYYPSAYFDPKLYPNPIQSGQIITADFYLKAGDQVSLYLYDTYGRPVAHSTDTPQRNGGFRHQWALPQLAAGVYTCQIRSVNQGQLLKTQQLVVF